jgi:hypothetical protein
MRLRDPTLDSLLELDGQVLVIDERGYWVRFVVNSVPPIDRKPHGLDYPLTLHAPDGHRLIGIDNAHQVPGARHVELDHRHGLRRVSRYDYRDAATLIADFWAAVEAAMKKEGVWL